MPFMTEIKKSIEASQLRGKLNTINRAGFSTLGNLYVVLNGENYFVTTNNQKVPKTTSFEKKSRQDLVFKEAIDDKDVIDRLITIASGNDNSN